MTNLNLYATLADYKAYSTARGQTASTDTADDAVIVNLLESASRYIDGKSGGRFFYPRIETQYYDIPGGGGREYSREVELYHRDLQTIITFLNGDGTSIASTQYELLPRNDTPKFCIRLKQTSTLIWQLDSDGNWENVLALTGIFGYHNRYTEAWTVGSTLAEDLDTSETGWDVTSGTSFAAHQIVKVDNEIGIVSSVASNTLTVISRPANGSTAATHTSGTTVYIWQPMADLKQAVLETANNAYQRRFGKSVGENIQVTGAGVVLSPRDIPASTEQFINTYRRYV